MDLFTEPNYVACHTHAAHWEEENRAYYESILCLRPIRTPAEEDTVLQAAHSALSDKLSNTLDDCKARRACFLCTLPKGHAGKCTHKPIRFKNKTINAKLDWIYSTPGNDDYIYKNRASRTFVFQVSSALEKTWKDKKTKKKCAIPLSEASTPLMIAAAYLDYATLLLSVEDISSDLAKGLTDDMKHLYASHKQELVRHYAAFARKIVDAEGFTICPVTGMRFRVEDLQDNNISNARSVQLGHVLPRSETEFTIRGKNILLMSREGNLLVGDCVFTENRWLDRMKAVVLFHS